MAGAGTGDRGDTPAVARDDGRNLVPIFGGVAAAVAAAIGLRMRRGRQDTK